MNFINMHPELTLIISVSLVITTIIVPILTNKYLTFTRIDENGEEETYVDITTKKGLYYMTAWLLMGIYTSIVLGVLIFWPLYLLGIVPVIGIIYFLYLYLKNKNNTI